MRLLILIVLLAFAPILCASPATAAVEARAKWASDLPLLRAAMQVEIDQAGTQSTMWFFWERTPNARHKIIIKEAPSSPSSTSVLIQDKTTLVIEGKNVTQLAAPWVMGEHLFGEFVEPAALLQWVLGLPGPDYTVGAKAAALEISGDSLTALDQSGWVVSYPEWNPESDNYPSLPSRINLSSGDTDVSITMVSMEAYPDIPADYSEFTIR